MKILITISLILTIITNVKAYSPFEKYDFTNGEYKLLGVYSIGSDKNSIVDSLREFYIEDVQILNRIKKEWTFDRRSPAYACGYHYDILLVKDGEVVESFSVNLNCDQIVTEKGSYFFKSELLSGLIGRNKKLRRQYNKFHNRDEGFKFIDSVSIKNEFIAYQANEWLKYEGKFRFRYDSIEDYESFETFMNSISEKLKNEYEDDFQIEGATISPTYFEFDVYCCKTLYEKFKLFEITSQWKDLKVKLTTYWHKE